MVLTKECSPRPRLAEVVAIYLKHPLFELLPVFIKPAAAQVLNSAQLP